MLIPAANSKCVMPIVENETDRLVWWSVLEVSGILCGVPVLQGSQKMAYLRVNCCCYCCWLPEVAAGVLVWTLLLPHHLLSFLPGWSVIVSYGHAQDLVAWVPGCQVVVTARLWACAAVASGINSAVSATQCQEQNYTKTVVGLKLLGAFKLQNHCALRL